MCHVTNVKRAPAAAQDAKHGVTASVWVGARRPCLCFGKRQGAAPSGTGRRGRRQRHPGRTTIPARREEGGREPAEDRRTFVTRELALGRVPAIKRRTIASERWCDPLGGPRVVSPRGPPRSLAILARTL